MKNFKFLKSKLLVLTILSYFSTSTVLATGVTVTVAAPTNPTAVPTLSGMMLFVLSLLLVVIAVRVAKQKNGEAGKFFLAMLGVTALISGGSGIKLISDAQASGIPVALMPGSGTLHLLNNPADPNSGFHGQLNNNTGQPLTVLSVVPDNTSSCVFEDFPANPCRGINIPSTGAGPIDFPDGQSCWILCTQNPD